MSLTSSRSHSAHTDTPPERVAAPLMARGGGGGVDGSGGQLALQEASSLADAAAAAYGGRPLSGVERRGRGAWPRRAPARVDGGWRHARGGGASAPGPRAGRPAGERSRACEVRPPST
eukprot:7385318-Prymnesium_polylepis.1